MRVDQLYTEVPTGQEYFVGNCILRKIEGSPMAIRYERGYMTFNKHTVVEVESDVILLTKEDFYKKFPHLVRS